MDDEDFWNTVSFAFQIAGIVVMWVVTLTAIPGGFWLLGFALWGAGFLGWVVNRYAE